MHYLTSNNVIKGILEYRKALLQLKIVFRMFFEQIVFANKKCRKFQISEKITEIFLIVLCWEGLMDNQSLFGLKLDRSYQSMISRKP